MVFALWRRPALLLRTISIIGSIACAVSAWWYVRNWVLYNDPIFSKALTEVLPFTIRYAPFSLSTAFVEAKTMFVSFFGSFGALQVPISPEHIWIYSTIVIMGAVGLIRFSLPGNSSTRQKKSALLMGLTVCFAAGLLFILNLRAYVFMGKYFFVALAPITILICTGICSLLPGRGRNLLLIIFICLIIAVNIDIGARILEPAFDQPRLVLIADQPEFNGKTRPLENGTVISQSFTSSRNNLCAIRIMFTANNPVFSEPVTFTLTEDNNSTTPLARITALLTNIIDTRYFFIFPPLPDSAGKTYQFSFSSPTATGTDVSLWYSNGEKQPTGTLQQGTQVLRGALFFSAYAFKGDRPKSAWEGINETAIRQGEYITVRELQMYAELPPSVKSSTGTHGKMERLMRAHDL
jgi:hypothetical protein